MTKEQSVPSADEVRGWLTGLSTWGRWGPEDDLGTLNYIGPAQRAAAARLVSGSAVVSCALPIIFGRDPHPSIGPALAGTPHPSWAQPQRFVIENGADSPRSQTRLAAYDAFLIAPHGPHVTHLDAPRHTVLDGRSYNDVPAGTTGQRGTVEAVRDGIAGRGVLLDVPQVRGLPWLEDGQAIFPDDLEACEAMAGTEVGRGDVLFVRTGYRKRLPEGPRTRHAARPGIHAACLPWLHEREVAVLASDVATDVIPHAYEEIGLPVHTIGMWAMGLWLVDNCDLERLANECSLLARWEFLAVLAPLALRDGTGSPINPLAVF